MRRRTGSLFLATLFVFALPSFGSGAEARARNAPYYKSRAEAAMKKRDYRTAVHLYREALRINPSYSAALLGSARAYLELGDNDQARKAFEAVLKLNAKNREARTGLGLSLARAGLYDDALKELKEVAKEHPGDTANNLASGELYERKGSFHIARSYYEKIHRQNPHQIPSRLALARIEARERHYEQSSRYLEQGRRIDPMNPRLYESLGSISLRRAMEESGDDGDPNRDRFLEAAYSSYHTALKLSPERRDLEEKLALIDFYRNRVEESLRRIEDLLKESPGDPLLNNLAAYMTLRRSAGAMAGGPGEKELNRSLFYLERSMEKAPGDSLVRFALEELVLQNGTRIPPEREIRKKLAAYHKERTVHYESAGRRDRMLYHLRRALMLDPGDRRMRMRRVEYYRQVNDYEGFLRELTRLSGELPGDIRLKYRLEKALKSRNHTLPYGENLLSPDVDESVATFRRTPTPLFIFDFVPEDPIPSHPGASMNLPASLAFHLKEAGRVRAVPERVREGVLDVIRKNREASRFFNFGIYFNPSHLRFLEENSTTSSVRYVVSGGYRSDLSGRMEVTYEITDRLTGARLERFTISGFGKEAIYDISMRAASRIRALFPVTGEVVKVEEGAIYLNLGEVDDVKEGDRFFIYRGEKKIATVKVERTARYLSRCVVEEGDLFSISPEDRAVVAPADPAKGEEKK